MFDFEIPFFPEQASTIAGLTDLFTFGVIGLGLFIGTIVVIIIGFFLMRYKAGSDADRTNPIDEHTVLELTWSFIPLMLVLAIFVWSASIYFNLHNPPANTIDVYVIAKQWMWKMQHPDGQREVNTLHVPINQPVRVTLTSQDVIHSFFVPAFRIKQDAVPGRFTSIWFEATQVGEYDILCAEYCGTEHSLMVGKVIAMNPADYEQWLRENPMSAPLSASNADSGGGVGGPTSGEALFTSLGCVTCHKLDGTTGIGPNLLGEGPMVTLDSGEEVSYDDEYIRESIINPGAKVLANYTNMMPSYQGQLEEEDLISLVQYIKAISAEGAESTAPVEETSEVAETEESASSSGDDVTAGETLFTTSGCIACHTLDGSVGIGPSLLEAGPEVELDTGEVVVYDADFIRRSILEPSAELVVDYTNIMPSYEGQFSDEELDQLVNYLLSINTAE